jgi:hypothetical protein
MTSQEETIPLDHAARALLIFFTENWRKKSNLVILTLTPSSPVHEAESAEGLVVAWGHLHGGARSATHQTLKKKFCQVSSTNAMDFCA